MKILAYIILFFSGTVIWGQETSVDIEFQNANTLYSQGDYGKAVAAYEKILQGGNESGELYFNLGNAYYKLNKTAPSIYNYEKALIINPEDQSVLRNLEFARKTLIDDVLEFKQLGRRSFIHNILKAYSYNTWAWFGIGTAFLVLISFIFYYLSNKVSLKRLFFSLILIFMLATFFNVTAGFFERDYDRNHRPGIVFAERTELKSDAKNSSQTLLTLHEGTKVFVQEEKSLWARVKLDNQNEGWIKKQDFKEIKTDKTVN